MAEDTTISDAIKANAAGPKAVRGDEAEVTQHSLPDQIAADKYQKANAAMAGGPLGGVRVGRLVPPASTGPRCR